MKTRNWILLLGIVIAIPVGWYLISPLFIDRTVNEDFPVVQPTQVMQEDVVVEESQPEEKPMEAQMEGTMDEKDDDMMEEATPAMEASTATPMPEVESATMTLLLQGEFYNIAHEGMGTATVYQLADGSRILRFENFEVLNGPDLHVYLAVQNPVPDTVGAELEGSLDLGQLKGNIGDQNYEIPDDLDLSLFQSVVIWCQPFRVPFNAAPLTMPQP